jgi:transketolase
MGRSLSTKQAFDLTDLGRIAKELRGDVIRALANAKSGHTGGSLGMADVMTALYFGVAHVDPKHPDWEGRDRVVLSNAHICPVLYAALAHRGFCSREAFIKTLRKLGSPFQGHSSNIFLPGIETSGGPLGQGVSQAVGMALAARMDHVSWRTYLLMSDGELDEGQTWEAIMLAGKERLSSLTAIVDRNNIQISGTTEDVMPLEPLADKWKAFNWHVLECDGHNIEEIIDALHEAQAISEKPTVILAHTILGKGVSFMENDYEWHGKAPNAEEARLALRELEQDVSAMQAT